MKTTLFALATVAAFTLTSVPAQAGDHRRHHHDNNYSYNSKHDRDYRSNDDRPNRIYYSGGPGTVVVPQQSESAPVRSHRFLWWAW